ncbi:Peptidoglycan/LPS O-acetylase OafA/YrhL, contains acyltransferase and SGNH-hydrolase domains [Paraburkholderia fungorum]|uniref:Peptidoglycan/LPS O-acetylase OafA/YrhL, contains acyltransferase and SGNH-hydrolase domains n=1 Tax=Paraburkholderia fungorum TaxID=134537 RepID=A0A1H1IJ42_9BURK|nr:acyltransferase [Paraburkholderia fungorum]SDR37757.1 Peptidoglycan/LPS O-acetylase OafA/YrhL, contains acyltransferase and SGNH-hydrolase domains [Paraburkholderia fungorum]
MNRKNSFDLIRLIAAIAVLLSHSFPLSATAPSEPVAAFTRYGSGGELAVDVFFVISGYLIAGSYYRSSGAVEFIVKRLLRLFPALFCVVLLSVFVLGPILTPLSLHQYFTHAKTADYLRTLLLDIRYELPGVFATNPIPNVVNGSLWTLPLEAFMYLLVAVAGITRCLNFRGCVLIALTFAWLHFAVPSTVFTDNGVVLRVMLYSQLMRLGILYFIGAAFAFAPDHWVKNKEVLFVSILAFAFFAQSSIAEVVAIITLPLISLITAQMHSKVSAAISKVGDVSYGVYLYAFPVQQTVAHALGPHPEAATISMISLPIVLVISFASWHLLEKPALTLKNRLPRIKRKHYAVGAGK